MWRSVWWCGMWSQGRSWPCWRSRSSRSWYEHLLSTLHWARQQRGDGVDCVCLCDITCEDAATVSPTHGDWAPNPPGAHRHLARGGRHHDPRPTVSRLTGSDLPAPPIICLFWLSSLVCRGYLLCHPHCPHPCCYHNIAVFWEEFVVFYGFWPNSSMNFMRVGR